MGILESLSAMGIGKLIVLGILSLVVGIPVLILLAVLLAGTIICVIVGPFALLSAPWKSHIPALPSPKSRSRNLSFGIVLLTIGAGIISLAYVLSIIPGIGIDKSPLVLGGLLLFGGLGLIISYIVVSRIEKRQKAE